MTEVLECVAKSIHDYDRRNSLGRIPCWSKLTKIQKGKYLGFAYAAIEVLGCPVDV